MKVQLDTEHKTVKLEKDVKLSKLVDLLEGLLPDGKWKEFTLETNTTIQQWSQPIIIRETRPYAYPWWGVPYVYCNTGATATNSLTRSANLGGSVNANASLTSGLYNLDVKG